ncbi:MAG: hypothetical protein IKS25_05520 [Oscillospiraceae bacterium]|nr:hypothetical protein [Oscillospiraceae bacterium]
MCNEKQPIKIVRGTTNGFVIAVTDETGEAYELQSGEFIRFGVKQQPTDTTYIFTKTITEANEDDEYAFTIVPNDTISLPFGSYWYDVGLQSGTDYFNVIPASPFEVAYNVTKWGT